MQTGDKLGPYEILAPIGAGGMGEVYRAHDSRLNRDVAIKVANADFSERFSREARAIAALNHTNICHLYDVGPNYLVMEYVEGPDLRGPLDFKDALPIIQQLIDGIEAAHEKNIVHRDLKPANIKITPEGVVKILDFGLAKAMEPAPSQDGKPENSPTLTIGATQAGTILGTAAYMAPEQAKGKAADRRSDIWSFGVILYEVLTGRPLFTGETTVEILGAVLNQEPDISAAPARVHKLLRWCLEKDRKQRLASISDARRMLSADSSGADESTIAPLPARSGKLPWVVAAALLAITTTVALWAPWRSAVSVDRPLMRLDVNLGPDAVARADVAISPDGTRIVFPVRGADGKPLLATRLLDQAAITPLPGTENGYGVFFSPDGQWIGFSADDKLKKVSLRGGAPVTLSDASSFLGASWGENGDIVASLNVVGGLLGIPASGGSPHAVTNLGKDEALHLIPQVLPGGNAVLFTAATALSSLDDANLEVVSPKTGAVKTLLSGGSAGRYLASNGSTGHLVYVRQGVLYAVAFDPVRLQIRGSPEQILEDVAAGTRFDISRNGTFVYRPGIAADQKWPVVLMDSAGKTEPLVTTPGNYSGPQFSPDGKRLALQVDTGKGQEIFVFDREKGALTRLTIAGGQAPVWSRDGEHLVFFSISAAGARLNWIRADGSGEVQVLLESKNPIASSGFSPDGRRLAYLEAKSGAQTDLWTLPIDTSDPEHPKPGKPAPFLQAPATQAWLVFSPDGRYVAYFSNESGSYEVYVRPAPGPDGKPGPGKWQISTGGGAYPQWSPNGRELFYTGLDRRIMVTDYTATTGGSFSSNKPRLWSDRPTRGVGSNLSYALAPDGKHVAVFPLPEATAEDKGAAHVTFLLNFFDELRRKVPAGK